MRRVIKTLLTTCLLIAMLCLMTVSASAKNGIERVTNLQTSETTETSVKLSWSKIKGIKGYLVYQKTSTSGWKQVGKTSKASCTIKNLEEDTKYTFKVCAYTKIKKKIVTGSCSETVVVTTGEVTPGDIENFKVSKTLNLKVDLVWDRADNADGYIIYSYDKDSDEYTQIATTKTNSYRAKTPNKGEKYSFAVRAYRRYKGEGIRGDISEVVSVVAKAVNTTKVHARWFNVVTNQNVVATVKSTGKKISIKRGTKLIAHTFSKTYVTVGTIGSGTITCTMQDGTIIKVKGNALTYESINYVTKSYSRRVMEAWVNKKGFSSNTNTLIWISQYTTTVGIFQGKKGHWTLIRRCKCVLGGNGSTPQREFKIVRCGVPASGGLWQMSIAYFPGSGTGYGFHRRVDATTRGFVSGGCIRISNKDLNFMYQHCKIGTTVISY